MKEKVEKAIESVRGYLQADGGDIELVGITDDNIVQVRLKGNCSGCPGAMVTLKMGVERVIKKAVPEIQGVEAL